jgi:hypothetical protein
MSAILALAQENPFTSPCCSANAADNEPPHDEIHVIEHKEPLMVQIAVLAMGLPVMVDAELQGQETKNVRPIEIAPVPPTRIDIFASDPIVEARKPSEFSSATHTLLIVIVSVLIGAAILIAWRRRSFQNSITPKQEAAIIANGMDFAKEALINSQSHSFIPANEDSPIRAPSSASESQVAA